MLPALKSEWFQKLFDAYNTNLLRRRFAKFWVTGLGNLDRSGRPLLIYANHSSWWDGLVAYHISRHARLNAYCMMEEKQVLQYSFLRRLGAFSVVRENPHDAMKSIEYAAAKLRDEKSGAVWIFPQGEIQPSAKLPFEFFGGAARIAKMAPASVVLPIAFKYEFLGDFKPEIFAKIGAALNMNDVDNSKRTTERMKDSLGQILRELNSDIILHDRSGYRNLI
jgi:1-acyl-sn-glycerol-3-phosphate acyltransferase